MSYSIDRILVIAVAHKYGEALEIIAAERNRVNPNCKVTADTLAAEAVYEYVDKIERMERALKPSEINLNTNSKNENSK